MQKNYMAKIAAKRKSVALLSYAKSLGETASILRRHAADQFGSNDGPNRFPVSGGVCEHWADFAKDEITKVCREWSSTLDESLALWRFAGCRVSTWKDEKMKVLGSSYCA